MILITGGTGFLGLHIAELFQSQGIEDLLLLSTSIKKNIYFSQVACDLRNTAELENIFKKHPIKTIIHTAAKAGVWGNKKDYMDINFKATKTLLELSQKFEVNKFIYTSTPSVVFGRDSIINGDESIKYPKKYLTHYAHSKALAEELVLQNNSKSFQTIALRPHLIWGRGDRHLIPRLITRYKLGKLKQVGNGKNLVDIIHVKNAAYAHFLTFKKMQEDKKFGGNAYFIGQEKPVNLWSFLKKILELRFKKVKLNILPSKLCYFIGAISEFVYRLLGIKSEPLMTRFIALQLSKDHYFSHDRAKRDFGYKEIITTQDGLNDLREFVNQL